MAVGGKRVTVTTTATRLDTSDTDPVIGQSLAVTNRGTASVDLGGASVTTGNGYELQAGKTVNIDLNDDDALYAVTASGTVRCDVLEAGI